MKLHLKLCTMLFFTGLLVCNPCTGYGQNYKKELLEAHRLMKDRLYDKASATFQKLHDENPDNANISYKLGVCLLRSSTGKHRAVGPLQKATTHIRRKGYKPSNLKENKAPVLAYFYLGKAFHLNYQMDNAIEAYQKFIDLAPRHKMKDRALREIKINQAAKKQVNNSLPNIRVTNVGEAINSEYSDYSPVVSADESTLFFTSRRLRKDRSNQNFCDDSDGYHYKDIYVSYKDPQNNRTAPELFPFSTPHRHEATIGMSPDGQLLFIYKETGGNGDLYQSRLVGDAWTTPELLAPTSDVNTKARETHITMSGDGNSLYFVSDRKGGIGGRDIYRVVKLPNGEWSKALNVGKTLNTPFDEDAPFLHPDGKTMYFASKGHNTMGGFDIFRTQLKENHTWTTPTNIGYPVNTVNDDLFYVTTANGKHAYYASSRSGGAGEQDIYSIAFDSIASCPAIVKGYIIPQKGSAIPEDLIIYMTNHSNGKEELIQPRSRDGGYVAVVSPGVTYTMQVVLDDVVVHEEEVDIPDNSCYTEVDQVLRLNSLAVDENNIYPSAQNRIQANAYSAPVENDLSKVTHWQLYYKSLPYKGEATIAHLTKKSTVRFTGKVGANGNFEYREVPGEREYAFWINVSDDKLCSDFKIVLIGKNGRQIHGTSVYKGKCVYAFKPEDVKPEPLPEKMPSLSIKVESTDPAY